MTRSLFLANRSTLVPTLCVGTQVCDAQRRVFSQDGTQSVPALVPTQSVGTRKCLFLLALIPLVSLVAHLTAADDAKKAAAEEKNRFEMTRDERRLLDLVNEERTKENLPALRPNPQLFKAAREHSANMAKQRKMEHVLDGKKPSQRVEAAGYDWGKVAENLITADQSDVPLERIVKEWMKSKIHRENILLKDVSETGLGIAKNAKDEIYFTQLFVRPRKVAKPKN